MLQCNQFHVGMHSHNNSFTLSTHVPNILHKYIYTHYCHKVYEPENILMFIASKNWQCLFDQTIWTISRDIRTTS